MTPKDAVKRPTLTSSVLAVSAALVVVAVLAPSDALAGLGVEFVGLAVVVAGTALTRRGHRVAGSVVAAVGVATALGGVAAAAATTNGFDELLVALPGACGVAVLGVALAPVRGGGSRTAVKLGTGLVYVSVLAAGLFRLAPLQTLLVATVGTVVAWDAGDRAIVLGKQVGRVARTRRLEAVRSGTGLLVGALAVVVAPVVVGAGTSGLPLSALAALLVAVLLLTAALHG
jgi:hypothetical protein